MKLIIVTGLSGAGKSCVMNALEDIGMFCMDNLPAKLIPVFAKLLKEAGEYEKVAVVTDIRAGVTSQELLQAKELLNELEIESKILYCDCSADELLHRYKQTRRVHPLTSDKGLSVSQAIAKEDELLSPVKNFADYTVNTSGLSLAGCKARVNGLFALSEKEQMSIVCMSFGFKHGIPVDADFVFDARFLPNPFYEPELKELTGTDKKVRDFVMNSDVSKEFENHLISLVDFVIPECINEGKSQLVIAVGCTGGHHRSVTFAESLYSHLKSKNHNVSISHRDILK